MITTILQGGCANQMFQYAMGLAQATRLDTELVLDVTSFSRDRMREYNLDLFPRIKHKIVTGAVPNIHENGLPYNQSIVDSIKDGDVLKGYWQTEKYFTWPYGGVHHLLCWNFEPKPLTPVQHGMLNAIWDAKNSTFLTVRRTDYVNTPFHGLMTAEYYREALGIIERATGRPDIFVFSDEPEWCRANLDIGYPFIVAGTFDRTIKGHIGREDADLYMMSCCRNGVLANSSFSWWGAWLGEKKPGIFPGLYVAPRKWFGTANEDPRDIVPDRWTMI